MDDEKNVLRAWEAFIERGAPHKQYEPWSSHPGWQGAENGNATMLIWLGKQMLGQKDRLENNNSTETGMRVIVELPQQQRFAPRLVTGDVEWKA
jgi:hypothetical protein